MVKNKILLIHKSLGLGGAEKIFAYLANCLSDEYNIEVLLLTELEATLSLNDKIKVVVKSCYSDKPIIGKNVVKGLCDLYNMSKVIKSEIKLFSPDLIICFDLRILLVTALMNRNITLRILFSERADPYENPRYWKVILKYIYKRIDYVVFQTEQAARFYGNIVKSKSSVIPNPAFPRDGNSLRSNSKKKEKYIFSAGRFQYRKGFDLLIKAFGSIHDSIPEYKLILYGEGEEEKNLIELINEYKINQFVEIKKPLNGVVEMNRDASLFVMPSRSEGIPNILLEAMFEGIPCVASDCSPGGARLISDNGRYCPLAKNNDSNSLADKIKYVFENYEEILKSTKVAKKSLARFDPILIKSKWMDVVKSILSE